MIIISPDGRAGSAGSRSLLTRTAISHGVTEWSDAVSDTGHTSIPEDD